MIVRPVVCRSFIARREELTFLRERRLSAAKSQGGVVLVAGDPGIGKSRLLAEFCSGLAKSRWRIGYGTCLEHAKKPYAPLLDALSVIDHGNGALSPAATKREQFDAIVARLVRAAAKSALLVVIEDLHWADVGTLELLAFLAPKLERLRILLLASYRPHDVTLDELTYLCLAKLERAARIGRIELSPLDEPSLHRFIEETASGYALPAALRGTVARTSEGNPFFAEELLKSAVERLSNEARAGNDACVLPSSLRATLLERWHLLPDEDRRVVAQAAVIGRTFEIQLLARTLGSGMEACLPALARARNVQLVEELSPSLFRFRHALTREAIYAEYIGAQLRPLHLTIATLLESEPSQTHSLERLAYHWWAAGDGERAARYNESAGDAAATVHAHEDAVGYYERALQTSTLSEDDRGRIVEKIADRCFALSHTERTHASYGTAAAHFQRAGDDVAEARCRTREALAAYRIGLADPTAPLESMLGRLDANAFLASGRVHLGIAWLSASYWYPTQAARHLEQIDGQARAVSDVALGYHNVAAWVAMTFGDLAAFRREFAAWIEAARTVGANALALAHLNGAWCHSVFGLHEEATMHIERALEITRAGRNRLLEEATQAHASACYLMSGDLARVVTALAAIPPKSGNAITIANAAASATLAAVHLDDADMIATWFDDIDHAFFDVPEASCGGGFAEVLVRRGKEAEAQGVLHRAIPRCEATRGIAWTLLATAKYGAPDDVVRARDLLATAAASPDDTIERPALALFDGYTARRAGRRDEAIRLGRAAAQGFAPLRFPLLEAAALEVAGENETALRIYDACGAVGDVRRLLLRQPVTGTRATALRKNGAATVGLSAREAAIAGLVASGKSNSEIARHLAISHKTVEKHLGAVYRKLGFSSRAQLAAYVGSGTATAHSA